MNTLSLCGRVRAARPRPLHKLFAAIVKGANVALIGCLLGVISEGRAETLEKQKPARNAAPGDETYWVTGRVLDKSGSPIADAIVEAFVYSPDLQLSCQTNTAADGNFGLSISRTMAMLFVSKPGFAYAWKNWAFFRNKPEEIVLTSPYTVSGVVVDESGSPVPDAEVWIRSAVITHKQPNSAPDHAHLNGKPASDRFSTRSAADGRFSIGRLPSEVGVGVAARKGNNETPGMERLYTINQMPYYAGQRDIRLVISPRGTPAPPDKQKYFSKETMTVSGIVRDAEGKAVKGVEVMTCPAQSVSGAHNPIAKSGPDGAYALSFLADSLRTCLERGYPPILIAQDAAHNLAATSDLNETTTNVNLTLQPGLELTGRVETPDAHPVTGAYLTFSYYTTDLRGQSYLGNRFMVNPDGGFRIRGLPQSRTYGVTAQAPGHGTIARRIDAKQTASSTLALEPFVLKPADRPVAGQLLDEAGQPLAGQFVFMYGDGQATASARTDADGRFCFEKVCEGTVYLSANSKGFSGFARATAGETNVVVQLKSRPER